MRGLLTITATTFAHKQARAVCMMIAFLIHGVQTLATTSSITVGQWQFTAEHEGPETGTPVILLHGYPNSRHSWTHLLGPLGAGGFRAVAPDQRGYSPGARPVGVENYHTDAIVSDVVGLADALGARRFHLVGHDWGGQIAWLTAIRHPERLHSLTVLSRPHPGAFAEAIKRDPKQAHRSRHHKAFQDPRMAARLLVDDAKAVRNTLCFENADGLFGREGEDAPAPKRRMSDEMAARHLSVLGSHAAMDAALNWYRAAFSGGSTLARGDTPPVRVPTLYFWGDEDMSVGREAAEGTVRHVDAAYEFVPINGAGHFLAEEVPEQMLPALLPHLTRNSPGSS